jgi:hypothetical protein
VWKGDKLTGEQLDALMSGLVANELDKHSYFLTGYMGSASVAHAIIKVIDYYRKKNPKILYCNSWYICDFIRNLSIQYAIRCVEMKESCTCLLRLSIFIRKNCCHEPIL